MLNVFNDIKVAETFENLKIILLMKCKHKYEIYWNKFYIKLLNLFLIFFKCETHFEGNMGSWIGVLN